MSAGDWANPAVRRGTRRMLERRAQALAGGERPIGWKLGFGAPASLEKFGLSGPLVGYLTDACRHPPGSLVSCEHWVRPVAEPEIAAHIGRDIESPDEVAAAITGMGPAIELADVDPPPDDIEVALAGNVYHRAVLFGDVDPARAGGVVDGLRAHVTHRGEEVADVTDVEALTGDVIVSLRHAAELLGAAGARIRTGDVVILGSVIPPLALEHGDEVRFELTPLPAISVRV